MYIELGIRSLLWENMLAKFEIFGVFEPESIK